MNKVCGREDLQLCTLHSWKVNNRYTEVLPGSVDFSAMML